MADISMCDNNKCPLKETCYRFKAIPNPYWQAYANFEPGKNGKCNHHLSIDLKQDDI